MNKPQYEQTLYVKNSSGKLIRWNIKVIDVETYARTRVEYGLTSTSSPTIKNHITKEGKNIGKINQTTYLEQAVKDAKTKVKKKLNEGYVEPKKRDKVPDIRHDSEGFKKPMLAVKLRDTFTYPGIIQPKFNGIRCEAKLVVRRQGDLFSSYNTISLKTREGKEIRLPHIEKQLMSFYNTMGMDHENIIFDGEIYSHGMPLQKINSARQTMCEDTYKLEYHIYDIKSDKPQYSRLNLLDEVFHNYHSKHLSKDIHMVKSHTCKSREMAMTMFKKYREEGYEGAMLRDLNAPYEFGKRSRALQKIKNVLSGKFLLVDIIESEKDNYKGVPIGLFVCKNNNWYNSNITFKCTPMATKKERAEYLKNKHDYINKYINVYYYERTESGIPFHSNGKIIN